MSIGSIYKRKDGRWEARLTLGRDKNGKRQSKSFYGRTREEAEKKLISANCCGITPEITKITVRELCVEWLQVMISRIKISTAANYRMKLEKHIIPAFGENLCHEVTCRMVQAFINNKIANGLSGRYVSDIVILLKSIFKYAHREYRIANVLEDIVMPKCIKTEVNILSSDQQKLLKNYINNNLSLTTLGIAMSLTMGLRLGEICALQWKDIDLEKRILTVRHTVQRISILNSIKKTTVVIMPPKSASSVREIPIPDAVFYMLKSFKNLPDSYIISNSDKPLEPRTMQNRFAKTLKNVKLPSVTFHSLRHAFATSAVELGFDIKTLSEILGHSKIEVTLNLNNRYTFPYAS